MPTLAQITANRAPATLGEGEDAINMHYHPLRITTEHMRLWSELAVYESTVKRRVAPFEAMEDQGAAVVGATAAALEPLDALAGILADILADWDVAATKEDEVAKRYIPITFESIKALGFGLNAAVLGAIMSARQTGIPKANGTRSPMPTSGGSTPKAARTTSRKSASRKR